MVACPCCGQSVYVGKFIEVDLNTNSVYNFLGVIKLTPRQAEVLSVLAFAYPRRIPWGDIYHRVFPRGEAIDPNDRIQNYMKHLRIALAPLGWTVLAERGIGYYLTELK